MTLEIEAALQQMRQIEPNVPIFQIQDYLIEIHPDRGLFNEDGYAAKVYHPFYREWVHLTECHLSQDSALEEARNQVRGWMKEQAITQVLESVFEQLETAGFSLAFILNGIA
jgi:hypothetical protein